MLSDQQNFEKADSYYDRAMKVDPSNANILVHRGLIQLQWKGDVAKAIEYLERAIRYKCLLIVYQYIGIQPIPPSNLTIQNWWFEVLFVYEKKFCQITNAISLNKKKVTDPKQK